MTMVSVPAHAKLHIIQYLLYVIMTLKLTEDSQRSMDSIIASNCVNAPQIELELNLKKIKWMKDRRDSCFWQPRVNNFRYQKMSFSTVENDTWGNNKNIEARVQTVRFSQTKHA